MSLKAKIEAVLFMTDKPLRAQAIAGIVGEDVQVVRQALLDLIHEYEERAGGLEIADEDGYSFQVKDAYANLMDEFLPIEMSLALLRTLSAIAIKQPIAQSEIIRVRGASAYDHIKELVTRELIMKREDEKSRSPMLSTTKKFQEYFRLTKDGKSLRQYLKKEKKKKDKEEEQLSLFNAGGGTPAVDADELSMPDLAAFAPPSGADAVVAASETTVVSETPVMTEAVVASEPVVASEMPGDTMSFAPEADSSEMDGAGLLDLSPLATTTEKTDANQAKTETSAKDPEETVISAEAASEVATVTTPDSLS